MRTLCKVWGHSSLTRTRKLEVFRSLIESRLLYALSTGCYNKSELRRLDGFQAKCLRRILGIPASYISRISNAAVREQCSWKSASRLLLERQLQYLGKVLRADSGSPLQKVAFIPGSLRPATSEHIRVVGRPRKEWIASLLPQACSLVGGVDNLMQALQNARHWKQLIRTSVLA